MNYTTLLAQIVTQLGTISKLKEVNNYARSMPDLFPAANVLAGAMEAEVGDSVKTQRTYTFNIQVFQPLEDDEIPREDAEAAFFATIDDIVTLLDDRFLADTIDYLEPLGVGEPGVVEMENGKNISAIVSFKCRVLENKA